MVFEFDRAKSDSNKRKHGIDFLEASALWQSRVVLISAKDVAEKRFMTIGMIGKSHWSAIITYRGSRIRIISVRRSTPVRSGSMKKPQAKSTTAVNLEAKFDRGEEVLDYFDTAKAKPIAPRERAPAQYIVELREAAEAETRIREMSGHYAAKASRKGAITGGTQVKNPKTGDYAKRNETPGSKKKDEFMDNKKDGTFQRRRERAG